MTSVLLLKDGVMCLNSIVCNLFINPACKTYLQSEYASHLEASIFKDYDVKRLF